MLSPENLYLKKIQLITDDPLNNAPKVFQLLGNFIKTRTNKREQYYSVVNFAIKKFEEALVKLKPNYKTLPASTLTEAATQCEKMISMIDTAIEITPRVFSLKKVKESKIEILREYQEEFSHEMMLMKKQLKAIEAHQKTVNDFNPSHINNIPETVNDFNPSHINDIPSQLQAKIDTIKQEFKKESKEKQVKDLLEKINAFLKSNNVQPKPEHAPAFRETLALLDDSLDATLRGLSLHPLSKTMKTFVATRHTIFKLTMTHTTTYEFEIQPPILLLTENNSGDLMNVDQANTSEKSDKIPSAISEEETGDPIFEFELQHNRAGVSFDQVNTTRNKMLISAIHAFKNCPITTEYKKTETLEDELNTYLFSLEANAATAQDALPGLRQYKNYLSKYYIQDEIIISYVTQLCRDLVEVKYGDQLAEQIVRAAIQQTPSHPQRLLSNQQQTLFNKPKPIQESKPTLQAQPLPVFLSTSFFKHSKKGRQKQPMHKRDRSPVRKK